MRLKRGEVLPIRGFPPLPVPISTMQFSTNVGSKKRAGSLKNLLASLTTMCRGDRHCGKGALVNLQHKHNSVRDVTIDTNNRSVS